MKDQWEYSFEIKTHMGLALTIVMDIIWIEYFCYTSPSLYVIFRQQNYAFPILMILFELEAKVLFIEYNSVLEHKF